MSSRRLHPLVGALVQGLALTGCGAVAPSPGSGATTGSGAGTTTSRAATSSTDSEGVQTCAVDTLPAQARDTIDLVKAGGPFPYPRNDGVTFGNYEGHLPKAKRGYYREYTVKTPKASNRGARRIITGGTPVTDPPRWYYTGDHYDHFCAITGLG